MLCFPTLRITLLCKKVFVAAIPMDYIFEFPFVTFFFWGHKHKLLDQKLISERLCKSQNFFLLVL
jgi:hypothetical protein